MLGNRVSGSISILSIFTLVWFIFLLAHWIINFSYNNDAPFSIFPTYDKYPIANPKSSSHPGDQGDESYREESGNYGVEVDGNEDDVTHRWYQPTASSNLAALRKMAAYNPQTVRQVPILPLECLEMWFTTATPCPPHLVPPRPKLDILTTWVNGSDEIWKQKYDTFLTNTRIIDVTDNKNIPIEAGTPKNLPIRHYRSTRNEILYSLRSVQENLGVSPSGGVADEEWIQSIRFLVGDWPVHAGEQFGDWREEEEDGTSIEIEIDVVQADRRRRSSTGLEMVGQFPAWLDEDKIKSRSPSQPAFLVHHHSDFFRPWSLTPSEDGSSEQAELEQYYEEALPTFNSFSIESQMPNIPDLSPYAVYLNDDFFLVKRHSIADFYSMAYGSVLRLSSPTDYKIPPYEYPIVACEHEWSSLLRSNWLMSQRFAKISRFHLIHVAKTVNVAILAEVKSIWGEELAESSKRRFREGQEGPLDPPRINNGKAQPKRETGDVNIHWITAALQVERARESMLWSWVTRVGGSKNFWDESALEEINKVFPMDENRDVARQVQTVQRKSRMTVAPYIQRAVFTGTGSGGDGSEVSPQVTTYQWSSLDGPIPNLGASKELGATCEFDFRSCFTKSWWENPTKKMEVTHVLSRLLVVDEGRCGDCLLSALVSASGSLGISAILPEPDMMFTSPLAEDDYHPEPQQPHLPLTKSVWTANYSLPEMIPYPGTHSVRNFSMELIARYQFVSSHTKSDFFMLTDPRGFGSMVQTITQDPMLASLGLNDDINDDTFEKPMEGMIKGWLSTKWPNRGWWEKDGFDRGR